MSKTSQNTVLILGATGRFGRNAADAFKAGGWNVRGFDRKTDTLDQAAKGADVIVNAWNPDYPDWAKQVPKLHADVIATAKRTGATVIVPGNVYLYGPDNGAIWGADTPHKAQNPLGRIRIEMERAYRDSGVRTIILRAGDFIDTKASGNWFDAVMTKPIGKGIFTYPGKSDIPHAWAFLPDLTRAAVQLADMRHRLNAFEDIAFPGYTLSGQEVATGLSRATGRDIRLKAMNWLPLQLAAPFWKMGRCLLEMRYLWNTPHQLSGDRFDTLLPEFRTTPIVTALASAVGQTEAQTIPAQEPSISRSTQTSR